MCVAITGRPASSHGLAAVGTRAALPMAAFALAFSSPPTLPTPHERRGTFVPVSGPRPHPGHDLLGALGMLPVQRPPFQNPLHTFALFNQLPPNGVYNGKIPCDNNQATNA